MLRIIPGGCGNAHRPHLSDLKCAHHWSPNACGDRNALYGRVRLQLGEAAAVVLPALRVPDEGMCEDAEDKRRAAERAVVEMCSICRQLREGCDGFGLPYA